MQPTSKPASPLHDALTATMRKASMPTRPRLLPFVPVSGALRSAADILVGGPPVPPTPAVTAPIRDQFITAPRTADQDQHLAEAFAAARALAPKAKCRPRLRDVGHQVARSKAAAGPGPSGWRNSPIACTYAHAAGPPALLAWATLWAQGDVPPWAAALWSGALARPFWKTPE